MSIATPSESGAAVLDPSFPERKTLGDLLNALSDIPAHRVRLYPFPGTATERDAVRATSTGPLCELVDGTLVEKPMGVPESVLASLLIQFIGPFVRQHRLGLTAATDGMFRMLHGNVREPDVSFTRRDRLPNPLPEVGGWCPDLCIEVLSPDNTVKEMEKKRREYFGAGCRLLWEINPRKRTAVVYTSADDGKALAMTDMLSGEDVLPGFSLPLSELFAAYDESLQPPS